MSTAVLPSVVIGSTSGAISFVNCHWKHTSSDFNLCQDAMQTLYLLVTTVIIKHQLKTLISMRLAKALVSIGYLYD